MSEDLIKKHAYYQYFLGSLSEQEQERIEDEYCVQAERRQELWAIFDEMVERFAQGQMNAQEAQAFALQLQTKPFLRERAEQMYMLYHVLSQTTRQNQATVSLSARPTRISSFKHWFAIPAWGWGAMATGIFCLGIIFIWLSSQKTENQEAEVARVQPSVVMSQLPSTIPPSTPQTIVTPSLKPKVETPGSSSQRSSLTAFYILLEDTRAQGRAKTLAINQQTQSIALHFEVAPPFQANYQGVVQTSTGQTLRTLSNLNVRPQNGSAFLTVRLAVAELPATDFSLQIRATNTEKNAPPLVSQTFHLKKE